MASTDVDQPPLSVTENGSDDSKEASVDDLKAIMSTSNHSSHNGVSEANHVGENSSDTFKVPSGKDKEHKERSKDGEHRSKDGKHHSSSSKHKDGSSSSSSKHRDSSSSKHKEGSSSGSSSKHSSSHHSSKHGGSSSSSKHKEGSSSTKNKEGSSSSKSKDGGSSSSSHSKEHKHSSDKHKTSTSSSMDKEKHRDKEKERSKEHGSSSKSSSDKHRSKDGEKSGGGGSSSKKESINRNSSKSNSHKSEDMKSSGDEKKPSSDERKSWLNEEKKLVSAEKKSLNGEKKSSSASSSPLKLKVELGTSAKSPMMSPMRECKVELKREPASDDDEKPLSARIKRESSPAKPIKRIKEESDDDEPLSARADKVKKMKVGDKGKVKKRKRVDEEQEDKDMIPVSAKKEKKEPKEEGKAGGGKKKKEADQEVWKWWEEEKREDGVKWHFLEHKGPIFAPSYEPLPKDIKFYYDGKVMQLGRETEEVATFYAKMLDHEYTTREVFNQNFFKDWRKVMSKSEKETLADFKKCNFTEMAEYFKVKSEERKNMSKEAKQLIKKQNEEITGDYGFCIIDGHKEKIGNFRIEPPGLFRGRGDHPKQGMLKRRVMPEDVIINCSKDSKIPKAPDGHKWKEVRHDNHVTWLSSWTENIQGSVKYVMLNAASKLKGEKDWQKYETARRLHKCVDKIRAQYREDWKSKEMRVRQRAVALYFIDKLALRAGNEKEEGETADTVGCCSLRCEHLTLHEEKDGKQNVVDFDFLGKDSIRYQNSIPVEKRVFKNLQLFMENKQTEDDVFDRLNTTLLNKHLQDLMEGLTAKVFRTYNASRTLQEQLNLLTNPGDSVAAKILSYNRANRAVAVLCNHQRAVPKTFAKSMENMQNKIDSKKKEIKQVKKDIKGVKADYKATKTAKDRTLYEKKKKLLSRLEEQLMKLEVQATDKDENKEISLGTSKLNYLDPRISIAWCKKNDVPMEKIYNKTQRDKFRWAIDMATAEFQF